MTELSFQINHTDHYNEIAILQNGNVRQIEKYDNKTSDELMIMYATAHYYGISLDKIFETEFDYD